MILHLQQNNLDIRYRPGKELVIADALSRAPLQECEEQDEPEKIAFYQEVESISEVEETAIPSSNLEAIRTATGEDPNMRILIQTIKTGWPNQKDKVPQQITPYLAFREELTEDNGIVYKGAKIVIPTALRADMLKLAHYSHVGINACIR